MKKVVVLVFSLLLLHLSAYAQSSCLDSTFADNGATNLTSYKGGVPVLMDDGTILILRNDRTRGKIQWYKLKTDGTLDNDFAIDGVYEYPINGYIGIDVGFYQTNDKSYLLRVYKDEDAGRFLKIKPDLSIDSTYGDNGIARTKRLVDSAGVKVWQEWNELVFSNGSGIYPDGSVLLAYIDASYNTLIFMRLTPKGHMDTTFGDNGIKVQNTGNYFSLGTSIKIMNDGRAVICGSSYDASRKTALMLMRILPNGSLDSSFHHTGMLHTRFGLLYYPYINDMCLQPDNKIIVTGNIGPPFVARFNVDGSPDSTFNGMGYKVLQDSLLPSLLLLQGEKILIASCIGDLGHTHSGITRLMVDGNIDSSFCEDGLFEYKPTFDVNESLPNKIFHDKKHIYLHGINAVPEGTSYEWYGQLLRLSDCDNQTAVFNCGILYPNPVTNTIQIADVQENAPFYIYDILGRIVQQGQFVSNVPINISALANAVYHIHFITKDNQKCTYKFVKQ